MLSISKPHFIGDVPYNQSTSALILWIWACIHLNTYLLVSGLFNLKFCNALSLPSHTILSHWSHHFDLVFFFILLLFSYYIASVCYTILECAWNTLYVICNGILLSVDNLQTFNMLVKLHKYLHGWVYVLFDSISLLIVNTHCSTPAATYQLQTLNCKI